MSKEKPLIIANWKMNPPSLQEAQILFDAVIKGVEKIEGVRVVLCPPFVYIPTLRERSSAVSLGAQDCFWEERGAFTGEISPLQIQRAGCSYVILGHSERKNCLGETYDMIAKKIRAALEVGLNVVICIGEKELLRDNEEELREQMQAVLNGVRTEDASHLILIYEPEWAISSNKSAQPAAPEECGRAIKNMRAIAKELIGEFPIPILYGGSTDWRNIRKFLLAGAQGALVGSASLDAKGFLRLVENAIV